jgi:hypothetical protein
MLGLVAHARPLVLACVLGGSVGCASVPTFPAPPHDGGVQCSMGTPCPSGQTCLQGLCFTMCDAMHTCSAREMCSAGVCVARTGDGGVPARDMGVDGGACAAVHCSGATPVCAYGRCVACQDQMTCGGTTGICDIGRGVCVAPAAAPCAPCRVNADCGGSMRCALRSGTDPAEQVCLPAPVGGACPAGFSVSGTDCVPVYFSCTALLAAQQHRACSADADCPQLGATPATGLFTGMCSTPTGGTAMICHWPCDPHQTTDCPAGIPTCNGTFCM